MICTLCPRTCGALRTWKTGLGHCQMPLAPVVARAALHHWEEPPISGNQGSGTIFFSGCSLGCLFCQNERISHGGYGKQIDLPRLREICLDLAAAGAHNINFVNPTHYSALLREFLETPLPVPTVFNTGGYDKVDTLRTLEGKIDIYLPDLKYLDKELARRYSGAEDYPLVATAAIREMVRQTGPVVLEEGLLTRGVILRHLLLPGGLNQAKQVMDWVAGEFAPGEVLFSLMSQYTPWGRAKELPPLNRTLRQSEIRAATEYMENLSLSGFCQDRDSAKEEYTPSFDLTGI